ncbi:Endonuclease/Exonuclease/phosphatase family protein [Aliarcobacter thereius]|uniref:Endonuclease/exonuclease/phosphatase family protein n=1 Tax=Aliarcobacter thereius TaxID=544718 RepID=A0A5R9H585_9BACT|nr:endonuclease/exonuclease/phosphatase family protein [Aliarcobacter thereius]OCL86057.1 Endonuclease/Exonuclease/phosphatase family protein [Aliarcobacter thereius]TLS71103.1 endonuclease/exonuclease/phosphatase family protein [Aliarcobacter thereius]TLT06707.1 endonuclease/exonuclease/phosphatase family protein [Aliarcobacter thereius]
MYKFLIILFLSLFSYANELKIASYNVENFFDLSNDGTEYKEFIPNNKSLWNQRNFNIKLKNILQVINDIDADIIALQEIENEGLMKLLKQKLPKYSYYSFAKYPKSAVGIGFLSKIPIKNSSIINVKFQKAIYRPILESTFSYENIEFKIFNNHWPSKRASENYRIKYAQALQNRLKELPNNYDYIVLGDLNSNYNEFETFKRDKKLNQSAGLTGINHILNTIIDDKYITYFDILDNKLIKNKRIHYNLWLELDTKDRFSTKFRNQNNTPDNMILSPSLFNNNGLNYILKSFNVFKPTYLFSNNQVIRWEMSNNKVSIHKGSGYSDHLPIYAFFKINKDQNQVIKQDDLNHNIKDISKLYEKEKLNFPIVLNNIVVLYKHKNKAIIKQKNDRAIYIFKDAENLELSFSYDLQINQIYDFYGLKEIKDFNIIKKKEKNNDYKKLFLDASKNDIFDFKFENEVISNLEGIYKNSYLYLNNSKKIKIFTKDKNILPKENSKIFINEAQLGSFKGNIQIILHKQSDFKELK